MQKWRKERTPPANNFTGKLQPVRMQREEFASNAPPGVESSIKTAKDGGRSLSPGERSYYEPRFGTSFEGVKIHTDSNAEQLSRSVNARAFTVGQDVFFGAGQYSPNTVQGKKLMAHELTHTVQQGNRGKIQRVLDDKSIENAMTGVKFKLLKDYNGIKKDTVIEIFVWNRKNLMALVKVPSNLALLTPFVLIPKTIIRPINPDPKKTGIALYAYGTETGEGKSKRFVTLEEQQETVTEKNTPKTDQTIAKNRIEFLNEILVKSAHYNRFDKSIKKWTDYYNKKFKYKNLLDSNHVKSMIFHESQMGVHGEFFKGDDSGSRINLRFNVMQAVDTSGPILLLMMQEIGPNDIKARAENFNQKFQALIEEYYNLKKVTEDKRTNVQKIRLRELAGYGATSGNWFNWFWKSGPHANVWSTLVDEFSEKNKTNGEDLHKTYDFWIRAGIRWLFHKRSKVNNWAEAIQAYNGGGDRAIRYRQNVLKRAEKAKKARENGKLYQPVRN